MDKAFADAKAKIEKADLKDKTSQWHKHLLLKRTNIPYLN